MHSTNSFPLSTMRKRAAKRGSCNVIGAKTVSQFAFGFNEPSFSDRILCVVPCEPPPPPPPLPLAPVLDHPHKRKQQNISVVDDQQGEEEESKAKKIKLSGECVASSVPEEEREKEEEQTVNEKGKKEKEQDVEETMKKKKKQEGDSQCGSVVQLHVNSLLLAAKSGFFKAMFAMGMMETTQKKVFPPTTSLFAVVL